MSYKANYSGEGEVLRMPGMVADMARRAEEVRALAEAIAPERSGEYKSKFEVESGVRHRKTTRAYGLVRNTDDKSIYIEYGTEDTPRFRTLGKALDAAG